MTIPMTSVKGISNPLPDYKNKGVKNYDLLLQPFHQDLPAYPVHRHLPCMADCNLGFVRDCSGNLFHPPSIRGTNHQLNLEIEIINLQTVTRKENPMYEYMITNITTNENRMVFGYTYENAMRKAKLNANEWQVEWAEYID